MQHEIGDIITITELDGVVGTYKVTAPFSSDPLFKLWAQQEGEPLTPNSANPCVYDVSGNSYAQWLIRYNLIIRVPTFTLEIKDSKVKVYK